MPNTEESIQETGGIPEIEMDMEVSGMTQTAVDKTLTIPGMAADAKAAGDRIADLEADIVDIESEISGISGNLGAAAYPVGSVYMTTLSELPQSIANIGTWTEVLVPLTWNDIKHGTRNYESMGSGQTGGTIHVWIRTE